jgi:spermidine synthase
MRWFTKFSKCIYTSPSGYKVYENFFYRWLTLDSNVLQTVINKKRPKRPVLYYVPALTLMARTKPNHCCILGLGGAGVVQVLASFPFSITAVDNSEEIIYIAQRYFMINKITNLNIIHQSAELYLKQCKTQYTHLLIDLYNAQSFPPECNNEQFFLNCKKSLTPDGFMAVNLANTKEQHLILQLIKQQFINTVTIPIKNCANMVIIASNHERRNEFVTSLLESKEITKIVLVTSWGYVGDFKKKSIFSKYV